MRNSFSFLLVHRNTRWIFNGKKNCSFCECYELTRRSLCIYTAHNSSRDGNIGALTMQLDGSVYFFCLSAVRSQQDFVDVSLVFCPSSWSKYLINAVKGFLQIWYKLPVGLKDKLITIWKQTAKGHCDLFSTDPCGFLGSDANTHSRDSNNSDYRIFGQYWQWFLMVRLKKWGKSFTQ